MKYKMRNTGALTDALPWLRRMAKTAVAVQRGMVATMAGAALLSACDSFEYHPYASNIYGRKNIHKESIAEIERICMGRDTVCFAFITDTQGSLDETQDAIAYLRGRSDVLFLLHGGDQSDFGLTKEFLWCRDVMETLHKPYLCVIGNHDCLGTGEHTFETIYGKDNFSLNAAFLHIVGLNTVALEYDYSHPVPDFNFMEEDITATLQHDSITNTLVIMHARPFDEQFNNNVAKVFQRYITAYPGMREDDVRYNDDSERNGSRKRGVCINGHRHSTDVRDLFNDGVLYRGLENMEHRVLQIYTITRDGYDVETVSY